MQTFSGENVFPIQRTYMDVSLSTIQNSVATASGRSSQPVHELGIQLLECAKIGDIKTVKELMSKGAPFSADWLGTSPLHFAAQYNHAEVARALLIAGISRDARNKVERTPLHVAAQEGHYDIVQMLIEYGADVDCKDMLRMTPLHWAAESGDANIIKLLLNCGADPCVENKFEMKPDYIAFVKERFDIVEMLREASTMDPACRRILKETSVKEEKNSDCTLETNTDNQVSDDGQIGKKKSQHQITRVLAHPKPSIINELPPTPPVEDVMSDCDRLEDELIKISKGHQTGASRNATSSTTTKSIPPTKTSDSAMQMLRAHGITMLPVDESSLIESAVQSGQTVILTEAGKLALNSTKVNLMQNGSLNSKFVNSNTNQKKDEGGGTGKTKILQNVQVIRKMGTKSTTIQCKKIFPISPEQLINMTKEKKVIVHNGDKKLGKPVQFVCTKPLDPALAAKLGNITVTNTTKQNETISSNGSPAKKLRTDETFELFKVKKELLLARKQIQSLQEMLKVKERENKQYKLQLETLLKNKMFN